ncbi:Retrovirus-related Pol polyprotein from transposon opus [Ceratobasidium sp. AG-Ba]|nr:Retrovirus-related Pol polyprotein from transposon opus [Ceratobasidium sp. AG-Ba]
MLGALANDSSTTKPHQAWAQHHKALGAALTMTDEEKVLQTLEVLPVYLLELLPKRDGYENEWDELITDIGSVSLRLLLNRYDQQRMVDDMYAMSLTQPSQPVVTRGWQSTRRDRSPPPQTPRTPSLRRGSSVRFEDTPQVAPATPAPTPNLVTRPPVSTPRTRDPAPHLQQTPQTPHTPGPVPNVLSRITASAAPPPAGANRIPDTPQDVAKWQRDVEAWKAVNRRQPDSLKRPFPLRPGTFEQTADSCTVCGMGDHLSYECEAAGSDVLDRKEQGYRRLVARKLRNERRAGTQPSTPSPSQRFRDTAQLEIEEPDYDPESDLGSGNE